MSIQHIWQRHWRLATLSMAALTVAGAVSFGAVAIYGGGGGTAEASGDPEISRYLQEFADQIPAEQQEALADEYVTYEEHEAAIQATIGCAIEAGVRMEPAPGDGLRPTRLGFVSASDEERHTSSAALGACVDLHLKYIETVQSAQPIDQAVIDDSFAQLAVCVNERVPGAAVDGASIQSTVNDLLAADALDPDDVTLLRAWDECRDEVAAVTGFQP